uniref:BamA/TamA family outer membrane protein n=1 Tax=Segatella hominis TaxID=2518605 RepID=UPI004024CE81
MTAEESDTLNTPAKKKSLITRFLDYFNDANKNKKHKKFDFSIIGGPHYSTDTKLGLGLVAAGLYRTNPNDTILPPSNVSLFGDVSTVGFYMLGIRGTHIFPQDKYRTDYTVYFYSFPCDYWGMGYDMGNDDSNKSEMKRWQARIKGSFLFHLGSNFYIGPMVSYDYVIGKNIERPELLNGMDRHTWNLGAGFSAVYDSRDVLTYPHQGLYINLTQCFRPRFMGNDYAFSTTELQVDAYQKVWKGAILAEDFRTMLNFGNPSWGMMALLGNSNSMRGYYEGRYRDKHKIEAQVELRQHIWKRNSLTVWVGAGTVFSKFSNIRSRHILPNYGLGYRWEFKKNVNVRLDYGFGKAGQSGFLFSINEAF